MRTRRPRSRVHRKERRRAARTASALRDACRRRSTSHARHRPCPPARRSCETPRTALHGRAPPAQPRQSRPPRAHCAGRRLPSVPRPATTAGHCSRAPASVRARPRRAVRPAAPAPANAARVRAAWRSPRKRAVRRPTTTVADARRQRRVRSSRRVVQRLRRDSHDVDAVRIHAPPAPCWTESAGSWPYPFPVRKTDVIRASRIKPVRRVRVARRSVRPDGAHSARGRAR